MVVSHTVSERFREVLVLQLRKRLLQVLRLDRKEPVLILVGDADHQAPPAIAKATYNKQKKNKHFVTEFAEVPGRGHSITIDSGWQAVAQMSLDFFRENLGQS